MKSKFLVLTFSVLVLLLSSFSEVSTPIQDKVEAQKSACEHWVDVQTVCGNDFSLCADQYESAADLVESAMYFAEIKC